MEYLISKKEISRRKRAYFTLSTNLMIGLLLGSFIFQFHLSIYIYLLAATSLFLIGALSYRFFTKLLQIKIYFKDNYLMKESKYHSEKHLLSDIGRVEIKWTKQKTIREIYIWLKNKKSVFVTTLDDFGGFKNDLLAKLNKDVSVKEKHEPIKYDHPFFYVVLGLLLGSLSIFGFKSLIQANSQFIKIGSYIFSTYTIGLGIYFLIAKPTSKTSGENTKVLDYIAGIILTLLGTSIFLLSCF